MRSQVVTEREATKIDVALLSEDSVKWDFIEEDHIGFYDNNVLFASLLYFIGDKYKFIAWTRE